MGDIDLDPRSAARIAELEAKNHELRARLRQQAALAALSQAAIRAQGLEALTSEAAARAAEALGIEPGEVVRALVDGEPPRSTNRGPLDPHEAEFLRSVAQVLALAAARHEEEAARRQEQEVFQAIYDNIPVMISVWDGSDRVLRVNREWTRTLGWTLEEARRLDIIALAYPDPEVQRAAREFMEHSERRWGDFRTRTKEGKFLDTSWIRIALSDGTSLWFGLDIAARTQAAKALAEAEARFARVFQGSPVALAWSTMEEGRIIDVNARWLELFSYRRDEVVGRTAAELALSFDRPDRDSALQRIRAGGLVRDLDVQVRRKSGEVRDLLVSIIPVELPGEEESWIAASVDITDRKRAEEERERARADAEAALARLRAIHTITDAALSLLGLDDLLRELLARLRATLHVEVATVRLLDEERKGLYARAADGVPLERIAGVRVPVEAVNLGAPFMTNGVLPPESGQADWYAKLWSALEMPLRAAMSVPLVVEGKPIGLVGVTSTRTPFTDADLHLLQVVADRVAPAIERGRLVETVRAGRERLEALSRRLLMAQEEERRRLAVELHDELGQVLTAIKIKLDSMERLPGAATPHALREVIVSVDRAMETVRDLALDLRPSVLDDLGLPAALRWHADRVARGAGLEAFLSIEPLPRLDPGLETACFRVAQEALTNVARHARARRVWITLQLLDHSLELRVRDDGMGFDVASSQERARSGASLGLLGMQERVSLLNGELEVLSAPRSGTEVRARFGMGVSARGST